MKTAVAACLTCLISAHAAGAATLTVFTDRTAFEAALPGPLLRESFESAALGTVTGSGLALGDLTFTYDGSPDGAQPMIRADGLIDGSREFMGEINASGAPSGNHYFSATQELIGFGADYASALTSAELTMTIGGHTLNFSDYLSDPGSGFLGVLSTTGFDVVEFGVARSVFSEVFYMDNIVYAAAPPTVAPIPLPASAWAALTALALLGALRLRARRRAS